MPIVTRVRVINGKHVTRAVFLDLEPSMDNEAIKKTEQKNSDR